MKDFLGFRFGNIHTDSLHLTVVSSGSRYDKNLLPNPTDYKADVPGGNGQFYFGQLYKEREFTINTAFDNIDEPTLRRISQVFSTDKPQDLVFDENPYKTYRAKLKSKPDMKYICFKDHKTGERIYKGEATFNFICYHPLAYGFNKYVVQAADYYKCEVPQGLLDRRAADVNPYKDNKPPKTLNGLIKDHYNIENNMDKAWKGGFPAKSQAQWEELYRNNPEKTLIDTRGYWDNIPKWESTAKLLTTPTLDYEQELIYAPQYNKVNFYNMDLGLHNANGLIGSRLLVYNPGDVPVDFKLNLGNLSSKFRRNLDNYTFRISRYNVQRLDIEQAVDWTGLRTINKEDNGLYKYGTRYFSILEKKDSPSTISDYIPTYKELKCAHPNHCYIVEPIPQEKLGDFIRLFYWQSNLLFQDLYPASDDNLSGYETYHILDHNEGEKLAAQYEEQRALCITEEEKNQLYWTFLKTLLHKYQEIDNYLPSNKQLFSGSYTIEDFIYDYIHNPQEYTRAAADLNYGEFLFNITHMPQYYTYDYLDINNKNFDKIEQGECNCDKDPEQIFNRKAIKPLILDSESRMLYNKQQREWRNCPNFFKTYPEKEKNLFNPKPQKLIFGDNIVRGHWFQLPPGWSMIEITPLVDETIWGGKRWLDARPFNWGTPDNNSRDRFNKIYQAAAAHYLAQNIPHSYFNKYKDSEGTISENYFANLSLDRLEDFMQFRRWFDEESATKFYADITKAPYDYRLTLNNYNEKSNYSCQELAEKLLTNLGFEIYQYRKEKAEIGFLKTLADYWRINYNGDIDEWWWDSNNFIWANYPPLYWGYADLLNRASIEYIPQFY